VRCAIRTVVFCIANDERSLGILFVCVFSLLRCYAPDLRAIVAANGHIEIESHLGEKKVKWHTEKNSVKIRER